MKSPNMRGLQEQPAKDPKRFMVVSMVTRDTRIFCDLRQLERKEGFTPFLFLQ